MATATPRMTATANGCDIDGESDGGVGISHSGDSEGETEVRGEESRDEQTLAA